MCGTCEMIVWSCQASSRAFELGTGGSTEDRLQLDLESSAWKWKPQPGNR